MSLQFEISDSFKVDTETLYNAWLDSNLHSQMTGGKAAVSAREGEQFSAWDGYISGKNLKLEYAERVLQTWRTREFSHTEADALLEICFTPEGKGARVTIQHSNLPAHGMQYKQGWVDAYFTPMHAFFDK